MRDGEPVATVERHIWIEDVLPAVDGGRHVAKAIAGDDCVVTAAAFRDGHARVRAAVRWRRAGSAEFAETAMRALDNDRFEAALPLADNALYEFTVVAWTDAYGTWLEDLGKRVAAHMEDVRSEVQEGVALLRQAATRASGTERDGIDRAVGALVAAAGDPAKALAVASEPALVERVARHDPRADQVEHAPLLRVFADRRAARFSAWYTLFARSCTADAATAGTLKSAALRLPALRDLGFDIVHLAPIHPIGRTGRKGRNGALTALPGDPGSPYAIGSEAGGHDAVDPALGTLADFDAFVAAARALGLEVALDLGLQCSPDHPWVKAHPGWFPRRPDGTLKHHENPPMTYEDVHPLDFDCADRAALWAEIERVVRFWIGRGVRAFRVDNPHTKPFVFWEGLIASVRSTHPDVLFVAEAFTRPRVQHALSKLGFTLSYTYFTWRNTGAELTTYLEELTTPPVAHFLRPLLFTNTPDVLSLFLQSGGRPAFRIRLILAATLAPAYGIYSGFELGESGALPGTEEYLDSEKFEIRPRDFDAPGNLNELIARVNRIRRENPALQELENLRFHETDNDAVLVYSRRSADHASVVVVAVCLDPAKAQRARARLDLAALGVEADQRFDVRDLLTGARWTWGEEVFLHLDPALEPAHIVRLEPRSPEAS